MKYVIAIITCLFLSCASTDQYSDDDIGSIEEPISVFGFYGVRNDGSNKQRLCVNAPLDQQCLFPTTKRVRVYLNTSGMSSGDSALTQQWITAIIDNTFNKSTSYVNTGWVWQNTVHQPHVTIVKGSVDNSLGSDNTDVRRYMKLTCNTIGSALSESPSKNGTYHLCANWTATLDFDKMRSFNSGKLSQMVHQCVALSMLAPAGIGVGTITPNLVTQQTIASNFLSTVISSRDLCALTVFNPSDLSSINFIGGC